METHCSYDELRNIEKVIPHPRNPNRHPLSQIERLAKIIEIQGWRVPISVSKRSGYIVRGHARLEAARLLELKEVPVDLQDYDSEEMEIADLIADNQIAELAEMDNSLLKDDLEMLDTGAFDMDLTGYDTEEIEDLMSQYFVGDEGLTDDDAVPEEAESRCKTGDLWLLGDHRLLCGDATKKEDVERLMAGQKADMVFTDPPYGMNLDTDYSKLKGTGKSPNAKGYKWKSVIGDDSPFNPSQLMDIFKYCEEQFWFGADYYFNYLPKNGSLVVWQKRDRADSEMIGNDFELCWSKNKHKKRTFWKRWVGFDSIEKGNKRVHPTQKPITLAEWFFEQWGKDKNIIVDPFLGSGSTLIACEKTTRKCYGMEIDEHYCDVILKRWEDFTGKEAKISERHPAQ